ncbi:MAG: reverse transcriptase family protein [Bacteroidota bacterium]|jgi:hypothetical protein
MNKLEIISNWQEYFLKNNIEENTLRSYIEYIKVLVNNDVPIIFEIDHLSMLLGVDHSEIVKVINSPQSFYHSFIIPKRNGGKRTISMPYPTLLYIQRWIKAEILDKVILNDCAHGFVSNKSILTNAKVHLGRPVILKLDIADFFPSINMRRVISIFRRFGYSHKVSFYLASFCVLDDQIPQGAATSPTISNIIAKKIDLRLTELAKSNNLFYSRYADDLTLSGNYISSNIILVIKNILLEEGFKVNDSKTRLITGNGKKIITGISINSHSLKLPKSKKRQLRQQGYYLSKYPERFFNNILEDPFFIERMIGKYNFWLQVEPDNAFALNIVKNLKYISNSILEYST